MTKNLPYLNQERIDMMFEHVYEDSSWQESMPLFEEDKLNHLFKTLKAMQSFNYTHRPDDTREVFGSMRDVIDFEINSEGATYWLALILAIKELYGFSNERLVSVMKIVSIR